MIFKHTILELPYEMDFKNMRHTFEKFFPQIQFKKDFADKGYKKLLIISDTNYSENVR